MQDTREQTEQLAEMLVDTRKRTLDLISDLDDEQMMGPQLRIVNPPLWEIGHLAWFQEYWNLRRPKGTWHESEGPFGPSTLDNADELYNSMEVPQNTRWDLPLLSRGETMSYMQRILDDTLHKLNTQGPTPENAYFARLATFHEDMHAEAFTYTRHTHGLPTPPISNQDPALSESQPTGPYEGDAEVPGGQFMLGAGDTGDLPFVFDNEKWGHPVEVVPFRMARAPVTNAEFARFVNDGGYERRELWSDESWAWRDSVSAEHPVVAIEVLALDEVVAVDEVATRVAVHLVIALAANDVIVASVAMHDVGARIAANLVVPCPGVDHVVTGAAGE